MHGCMLDDPGLQQWLGGRARSAAACQHQGVEARKERHGCCSAVPQKGLGLQHEGSDQGNSIFPTHTRLQYGIHASLCLCLLQRPLDVAGCTQEMGQNRLCNLTMGGIDGS